MLRQTRRDRAQSQGLARPRSEGSQFVIDRSDAQFLRSSDHERPTRLPAPKSDETGSRCIGAQRHA
jgi:hypothetical protein